MLPLNKKTEETAAEIGISTGTLSKVRKWLAARAEGCSADQGPARRSDNDMRQEEINHRELMNNLGYIDNDLDRIEKGLIAVAIGINGVRQDIRLAIVCLCTLLIPISLAAGLIVYRDLSSILKIYINM
jgi:hypothetical protein